MNRSRALAERVGLPLAWGVALLLHAMALDRWWLAGVALGAAWGLGRSRWGGARPGATWSWWRGGAAAGVGAVLGWFWPIEVATSGPLSATVLSLLTGMVIGLGTESGAAGRMLPTGLFALGLATLSGQVNAAGGMTLAFDLFVGALVLLGLIGSGAGRSLLHRRGLTRAGVAVASLVVAGWLTLGLERQVREWEEPFLGWLQSWLMDQARGVTGGASRDLVLSARGQLELSERAVFELSRRPERVRTRVFDQYDGTRFSTSAEMRRLLRPVTELEDPGVPSRELDFVACDAQLGLVPAPGGTWGAEEFEPRVDGGQVLSTSTPVLAGRLRYDPREWLRPEPAPSAELTQLPANLADPLAELAGEILGATQEPRDQAERLERHFREAFDYSLETDLAGREHPLLVLVRERRPASCGYFAAAYVLLLRSRGVPARVVTGYLSPPANRWTGGVTLREADAHAWAEVYLPGEERWVAFDPTPAESRGTWHGVTEGRGSGWWGGWGELRRGVESWSRRRWLAWRRDPLGATARGLAWGVGALFVGWLGWRVWRRRGVRGSGVKPMSWEAPDGRLRESRVVFLESLAALGIPFDPAESDEERLARLSRVASPAICARAERFLAMYHAARYGGGEPSGELLTAARVNSPVSGGTGSDSEPGVRAG